MSSTRPRRRASASPTNGGGNSISEDRTLRQMSRPDGAFRDQFVALLSLAFRGTTCSTRQLAPSTNSRFEKKHPNSGPTCLTKFDTNIVLGHQNIGADTCYPNQML